MSIIVTTKDSESTLRRCLDSIRAQTYSAVRGIEVIVVDNYSTDSTQSIAKEYGARLLVKGPERTAQVNAGVLAALGDYVYWVASDWVLDDSVVDEAVRACEEEGFDAIAVHNVSDPTVSFWARVRKFERDFYDSDPWIMTPDFFRRQMFVELGGYDESLVACEEYELQERIAKSGYKIGSIRAKELHIGEPRTLREVVLKHYYYGKTILQYVALSRSTSAKRFSPIRIGFVKGWRRFFDDPSMTMGLLLYQYVRYLSVAAGAVASLTSHGR